MSNPFEAIAKEHAKNIKFFFAVCKSHGLLSKDFIESPHAQNLEVVARLFGYTDFHQLVNEPKIKPKFKDDSSILLAYLNKLNKRIKASDEKAIQLIIQTIGVEIPDSLRAIGRYTKLPSDNSLDFYKAFYNAFDSSLIRLDQFGLWAKVSPCLLRSTLSFYNEFDDVERQFSFDFNEVTAFKPQNSTELETLRDTFNFLLPMCNYESHKDELVFCFTEVKQSEDMFFTLNFSDCKDFRLRCKIRENLNLVNKWLRMGCQNGAEYNELKLHFFEKNLINLKTLCQFYSYALKLFFNIPLDESVVNLFCFNNYGSFVILRDNLVLFDIESPDLDEHDDFYQYLNLNEISSIDNTTTLPNLIAMILDQIIDKIRTGIEGRFKEECVLFISNYLIDSTDIYYLFENGCMDQATLFPETDDFIVRTKLNGSFDSFQKSLVDSFRHQYLKITKAPI